MLEIDRQAYEQGLNVVEEAIGKIEALDELDDETFRFERDRSLTALRDLGGQIRKNRPLSRVEQLEHQLNRAIEKQEFERAAQLRDRIRELRKSSA
jgi:excinuclease UvrABC helicase subunit UvrB